MKPTYQEKNLLDYLFGGFRSTLKVWPYSTLPFSISLFSHCIFIPNGILKSSTLEGETGKIQKPALILKKEFFGVF